MILVVAPYSPASLSILPPLGASRKIGLVFDILSSIDETIVLINTAHNKSTAAGISQLTVNNHVIHHIVPSIHKSSALGKLFNLFEVQNCLNEAKQFGNPQLVWVYNGYTFENIAAMKSKWQFDCPIVLEFEDWHFARERGLNPKPYIDYLTWKIAIKSIDHAFVVNDQLKSITDRYNVSSTSFQGIIPKEASTCTGIEPFTDKVVTIGYFGGLSTLKGGDVLVGLVKRLPKGFKLLITGVGPFAGELTELTKRYPDKLEFLGIVDEHELHDLIISTDIILNPHSPIDKMGNGVFPFKIIEAVSNGRLVISTQLPMSNIAHLLDSIYYYDGSAEALLDCIVNAHQYYLDNRLSILRSKSVAMDNFSLSYFTSRVSDIISDNHL